jgi:hypothetical protein
MRARTFSVQNSDHEQWLALAAERRELYEKEGVLTQQKQEQRSTVRYILQSNQNSVAVDACRTKDRSNAATIARAA